MEIATMARRASAMVVSGIPAFVVAGAAWHFTHSWVAVGLAVVVVFGAMGAVALRLKA